MEKEKRSKLVIALLCVVIVLLIAAVIYLVFFNDKKLEPQGNDNVPVDNNTQKISNMNVDIKENNLYVNGKKVSGIDFSNLQEDYIYELGDLLLISDCSSICQHFFVDEKANVVGAIGKYENLNTLINPKYYNIFIKEIKGKDIYTWSYNYNTQDSSSVCDRVKTDEVGITEKFTYLGNKKFSSPVVIETMKVSDLFDSGWAVCNNNQVNNTSSNSDKLYHIEDGEKFNIYGMTPGLEDNLVPRDIEISFAYPVIDIDSAEVKNINQKIANQYKEDYNTNLRSEFNKANDCVAIKSGNKYYGSSHIYYDTYKVFEKDNYLSIVVVKKAYTECAGGYNYYTGYVIDKTTKKVMSNAEIVKMFNANEKVIVDKYNENAGVFGYAKATSVDDIELFIYDGNLAAVIPGNGDSLMKYNNGQLEDYYS